MQGNSFLRDDDVIWRFAPRRLRNHGIDFLKGSSLRSREKVEQVQAEPRQGNILVNTPNARRLRISAKEALAG
jgi:hypothetical protein